MTPRETENNAYAKFWGDKQRALLYVMVFSGVVNTPEEVLFEWLHHRISSPDSNVGTTLYSVINSTTGKCCSVVFI